MQSQVYYFKVFPRKISIHKNISYSIHPLTKFRIVLYRNAQVAQAQKEWTYAGSHNGTVTIQNCHLDMKVQNKARANFFTLKLHEIKYSLQMDDNVGVRNIEKQEVVGKHNLFIKNYISKFKFENTHYFEEQAQISADFVLFYEVFVEKTQQGLDKIVFQHQRLNFQNRPRGNSQDESMKSQTFSDDKINQIQVKGQNRFKHHANIVSQNALIGSQSKLNIANFKKTVPFSRNQKPSLLGRSSNLALFETTHKSKLEKVQNEEELCPPELQVLDLKRLSSQETPVIQLLSPDVLIKKINTHPINQRIYETNYEKKRKLLQNFQIKRLQFKRKLNESKENGESPRPLTSRKLRRTNSTRSMRSVRFSEWQKIPEQKPWIKKEKQKSKARNKKILYALLGLMMMLMYIAMQPNKNYEIAEKQLVGNSVQNPGNRIQNRQTTSNDRELVKNKRRKPKIVK